MEISPGDIVYSVAGRDSGLYFVVMAVSDNFALICDGRNRKAEKPKRKKLKHLKTGFGHSVLIAEKLQNGEQVTNVQLKAELKPYIMP